MYHHRNNLIKLTCCDETTEGTHTWQMVRANKENFKLCHGGPSQSQGHVSFALPKRMLIETVIIYCYVYIPII